MNHAFFASLKQELVNIQYSQTQITITRLGKIQSFVVDLKLHLYWKMKGSVLTGLQIQSFNFEAHHHDLLQMRLFLGGLCMYIGLEEFYEVNKILGTGGQSVGVYDVINKSTTQEYAMKQMLKSTSTQRELIFKEIMNMKKLNHINIIQIIECYEDEQFIYIIMDKLFELHVQRKNQQQLQKYLLQILEGTQYMHQMGIIHRDLKISNLMEDDKGNLKIIDFGLSTSTNSDKKKRQCGTPGYIAPEVFTSNHFDEKCDMFSIGVIMFELYFQSHLFQGTDAEMIQVNNKFLIFDHLQLKEMTNSAQDLFLKLIDKDPQQRYSDDEALDHDFFQEESVISNFSNMHPKFKFQSDELI